MFASICVAAGQSIRHVCACRQRWREGEREGEGASVSDFPDNFMPGEVRRLAVKSRRFKKTRVSSFLAAVVVMDYAQSTAKSSVRGGGLQHNNTEHTTLVKQSWGPQCQPLNKSTLFGWAGRRPEGRTATLEPCRNRKSEE